MMRMPSTHAIHIIVHVDNSKLWSQIWDTFCSQGASLEGVVPYVNVSSYDLSTVKDETEPEYHDEDTLFTVFSALKTHLTGDQAQLAIHDLQNAGILFRQRRYKG